jgi:hypothetical protein
MTSISFDTLAYAKKLMAAGFTQQQAEVQAEALRDIIEDKLATKEDLKNLELRLIIKVGAMMSASIVIIVTLMKLIH